MRYLVLVLLLVGCTLKEPIGSQPAPKYVSLFPKAEWNDITVKALNEYGKELLKAVPADAEKYCPKFKSVDKVQFYLGLISQLAKFESGFNPAETYQEDFTDAKGSPVVSRGLLQISIESGRGYGCPLAAPTELHTPETNLECGVRILNRWIPKDGLLQGGSAGSWKGAARYWSPFRKESSTDLPYLSGFASWLPLNGRT